MRQSFAREDPDCCDAGAENAGALRRPRIDRRDGRPWTESSISGYARAACIRDPRMKWANRGRAVMTIVEIKPDAAGNSADKTEAAPPPELEA